MEIWKCLENFSRLVASSLPLCSDTDRKEGDLLKGRESSVLGLPCPWSADLERAEREWEADERERKLKEYF